MLAMDWASNQKENYMKIYMDLDNAHDRLRWDYVIAVPLRAGFGDGFCMRMSTLFNNVNSQVNINEYF